MFCDEGALRVPDPIIRNLVCCSVHVTAVCDHTPLVAMCMVSLCVYVNTVYANGVWHAVRRMQSVAYDVDIMPLFHLLFVMRGHYARMQLARVNQELDSMPPCQPM